MYGGLVEAAYSPFTDYGATDWSADLTNNLSFVCRNGGEGLT